MGANPSGEPLTNPNPENPPPALAGAGRALWVAAGLLAGLALILAFGAGGRPPSGALPTRIPLEGGGTLNELPDYTPAAGVAGARRGAAPETVQGSATRYEAISYTVTFGDSLFGIANQFDITPETLLWANEATLAGRPDVLAPDMVLTIPPTNGMYTQWQDGDTLGSLAARYGVDDAAILEWPGNPFTDLTNPSLPAGTWVMIPGGQGEFTQFVFPDLVSGAGQGVSNAVLGPGACSGSFPAGNGSGSFVWPSPIRTVVGNDYWDGHRAIDIATGEGIGVYAADSGVVLFSGWANGGYGYMVYIDHGNGYSTVYAHLSQATAPCGRLVGQGEVIGYGGSTGNSTGPHLHFEVRFQGGFLNPWQVLPAP